MQRHANGETHSTQNFGRSEFSTPHFARRIAPSAGLKKLEGLGDIGQNDVQF